MSEIQVSRREVLGVAAGALLAGCAAASEPAQSPSPEAGTAGTAGTAAGGGGLEAPAGIPPGAVEPVRWAPATELVNSMEFEDQARLVLAPEVIDGVAGSDREPFNRITLHQQLGSPTLDMDLGVSLFGQILFTPLMIGPIANLGAYHAEGESAVVRGASEAYTGVIVSSRSSVPFAQLVRQTTEPLWYGVYAEAGAPEQARAAAGAGARTIVITVGATQGGAGAGGAIDWRLVDSIRAGLTVPVVVKGIRTPAEAIAAIERGAQGIVVSNHGAPVAERGTSPMDALPAVADAVNGRVPILIDGSFRRGSDVVKALTLGAQAALISRPAAWAVAAYGADGVRVLMELMHNEVARAFAMLGVSTPARLTRENVRIHRWATS